MRISRSRAIGQTQAVVIVIIVALAAAAGGIYAGTTILAPKPSGPININLGLLTHLSGPVSPTGLDIYRAYQLAVQQINSRGGVYVSSLGRNLSITPIVEDQQSSVSGTISAATRLVTVDKADIVVGGYGSAFIMAARKVITDSQTPYIVTGVSTPKVVQNATGIDPSWLFLYQSTGPQHGGAISQILAQSVKPAVAPSRSLKVAALLQDSAFGADFWAGMNGTTVSQNLPLQWVYVGKFAVGATDMRSLLTAAEAAKPDVIVPVGFDGETIAAIRQGVEDLGIHTIWGPVCTCDDDTTFYSTLGQDGQGALMETFYGPYTVNPSVAARVNAFRTDFSQRWGTLPGSQGIAVYDAVYIAVKAIQNAGTLDKTQVRNALTNLQMPQLLIPVSGGAVSFGAAHQQGFIIYGTQFIWNATGKTLTPVIIWPDSIKSASFQLPTGYQASG